LRTKKGQGAVEKSFKGSPFKDKKAAQKKKKEI
jgi:hypothetical protein